MKLTREEIEVEADRLLSSSSDQAHRRYLLIAWLQSVNGIAVDQRCPHCAADIVVEADNCSWIAACPNGCDRTAFRGI